MNGLFKAPAKLLRLASGRALAVIMAVFAAALPTMASASEGDVRLAFTGADYMWLYVSLVLGVLSVGFAFWLRAAVLRESPGSEKMQEVGLAIREGALAYLKKQVSTMLWFVVLIAIGLYFAFRGSVENPQWISVAFMAGVTASYIAGYTGMLTAVNANMRTANAALTSYKKTLEIAFRSGAVAGMITVGMGLIGATLILLLGGKNAMQYLVGFGFGGSLAALFMRVGGGIFTKAADVGADLVGKVEAGIPEDDPRNPATIADNVGDNVGDCAGMAADVFESYEVTLVAAIVLGAATSAIFDQHTWMRLVIFALIARGVGIVASALGILSVKGTDDVSVDPLRAISKGFYFSAVVALLATFGVAYYFMGGMKDPIRTNKLTSAMAYEKKDFDLIRTTRDQLAATNHKKTYEITAQDLLASDALKTAGFGFVDQRLIASALSTSPDTLPSTPDLAGYLKVDFNDSSNPVLNYATYNPDSVQTPTAPRFVDIKTAFGKGDWVIAQVHRLLQIPATAAQGALPAQPAKSEDITVWVGPVRKTDLDTILSRNKDLDLRNTVPVGLYSSKDGDLIFGLEGKVDRPNAVQSFMQMGYFHESPTEVLAAMSQPPQPGAMPAVPQPESIGIASVDSRTVPWYMFGFAIAFGLFMAFAIERLTDYYVSTHKKPVQEIAGVSTAGPAPMIIQGFAYAAESSVFMVFAIVVALLVPLFIFTQSLILSFYGIALVGLGLLTTTGYVLAMDTFGPISDNAQGVYEMSGEGHGNEYGSKGVQRLDAAGNTTKALTKGFAIATAVVAAVALFHSYLESSHLEAVGLRLDLPEIFLGLLIGGASPYLFSASTINAVGRASFELINEVRRQFRADKGIMAGTSKPDYARCVAIVTAAAQRELIGPAILAIFLPVAVAFGFSIGKEPTIINGVPYNLTGAEALGGFLAGAILSGQLMAVLLANSGGMWDNAKKLIEDGLYGGKGSDAHKAAVVCDTVGDPFKDTAGPALNPLIKVMNLVALLFAPLYIEHFSDSVLIVITLISVAALVGSIFWSKRGSMSTGMAAAQAEADGEAKAIESNGPTSAGAPDSAAPKKKKIKVEESEVEK